MCGSCIHPTARCVHVDPEKIAQIGPLEVGVHLGVGQHTQQLRHWQDGLADGLNEKVLSLNENKSKQVLSRVKKVDPNVKHVSFR